MKEITKKMAGMLIISSFIFILLLLYICTASLYMNAYGVIRGNVRKTGNNRTSLAYVMEKVSHVDSVFLEEKDGIQLLCMPMKSGDMPCVTMLYGMDGNLRELVVAEGIEPNLSGGIEITEAEGFSMRECGRNLIEVSAEGADSKKDFVIIQRKGEKR